VEAETWIAPSWFLVSWTMMASSALPTSTQFRPGGFDSLADIDLRSAVYLAGRLLATLYNIPISEVRP